MRTTYPQLMAAVLVFSSVGCKSAQRRIGVDEYKDKVYAAWVGQCIGNMYGLAHEFKYNDEPRTEPITGWADNSLDRIREADGAFSDDDTDIEYVDLFVMEKYGPEPTYENLAEFWKLCINHHIWVANAAARELMRHGYLPPLTGRKGLNRHWFQIDPQLVCEIWAVTTPGMLDYAAAKADWAAKVTNDDYGTHPTIWYNVMYAAAFFEKDVKKLCRIGYEHVPEGSIFRTAIDDVRAWKKEHGDDWVAVRKKIKEKYNDRVGLPKDIQTGHVSALLNGALGVLALLYGEGDFEKTMNYACMAGYDADNQCATLAGLVGIVHGSQAIPRKYTHVLDNWKLPLNDFYKNRTRDHLPDGKVTDIADRTAAQGIEIVEKYGGKIRSSRKGDVLVINTKAKFAAPLEARIYPIHLDMGDESIVETEIIGGKPDAPTRVVISGVLPPGMKVSRHEGTAALVGTPTKEGEYQIQVEVSQGVLPAASRTTTLPLFVYKPNLARSAKKVLAAVTQPKGGGSRDLNVLRDRATSPHYDSWDGQNTLEKDFYGYEWDKPVTIGSLRFTAGPVSDNGGYFETFGIEYRNEKDEWIAIEKPDIDPLFTKKLAKKGRQKFTIRFEAVKTTAIRIVGKPGGKNQFTSIAELSVHEDK